MRLCTLDAAPGSAADDQDCAVPGPERFRKDGGGFRDRLLPGFDTIVLSPETEKSRQTRRLPG